jgi:hypothetical protein
MIKNLWWKKWWSHVVATVTTATAIVAIMPVVRDCKNTCVDDLINTCVQRQIHVNDSIVHAPIYKSLSILVAMADTAGRERKIILHYYWARMTQREREQSELMVDPLVPHLRRLMQNVTVIDDPRDARFAGRNIR